MIESMCMIRFLFLIGCLSLITCTGKRYDNPHVEIITSVGDIEVELYPSKVPKTVAAFLENVSSGLYKNSSFYRVLKMEGVEEISNVGVIQGGIWKTAPQKITSLKGIEHESTAITGLTHTDGTVSMARTGLGTAKAEFFICIGDQSPMDAGRRGSSDSLGYAAFGKVINGMSIVRKIQGRSNTGDALDEPIVIQDIKRL